jgi:hypothetical protein
METIIKNDNFINKLNDGINSNNNIISDDNRFDGTGQIIDGSIKNMEEKRDITTDSVSTPMIFRFKFTQEFMDKLHIFSKIHQYDERKDFKEAWEQWVEENEDIINIESRRITNLGYDGDIMDKMFKSARYYFRKKTNEKKVAKERRKYISIAHDLLDAMDMHIMSNIGKEDYQPKNGFIIFCKENEELLKNAINEMLQQGINDSVLIQEKIKKTYKNRYFIISKR